MVKFYNSLSEKDKRRYAAIEAKKLGHGGIKYISAAILILKHLYYKKALRVISPAILIMENQEELWVK